MVDRLRAVLGTVICLVVLVAAFLAFFTTGQSTDGLGRPLTESPVVMRFFFGQDRSWAGWGWFVADMIWFWGGLGLGISLLAGKRSGE